MDEIDIDRAIEREGVMVNKAIGAIVSKLSHGTGSEFCVDCDDPIPEARRRAVPSADRCVSCQEGRER